MCLGSRWPEVVLNEAQVVPLVSEREATGVPQRVRVGARQAGTLRCRRNQVIHSLPGERLITLGDEQPGQRIGARSKVSLDGAQFVTGDRLLDGQPALEAAHPQPGAVEVEVVAAQAHGLADPQAVAIGHEQKQVVAHAMTAGLGGVQQPGHFSGRQVVLCCVRGDRRHRRRRSAHSLPFATWLTPSASLYVLVVSAVELAYSLRNAYSVKSQAASAGSRSSRRSMSRSNTP